jgi:outer membrane immunogenic protein
MKKYRVGLLAFTLTSVAALASANAADMYVAPPAGPGGYKDAPYVARWAGFYAGVNGGYGWSDHNDQFAVLPPFGGIDPKGGFGGGQIGYNWQGVWHPNLVLGVEADIQGAGIEDKRTAFGVDFKSSLDYFGTVRGRLGYAFGSSLLYATGGLAYGGIHNEISAAPVFFKKDVTATGYAVGGGWEYKFNPAWSLKAEYQFIDLGRNDPALAGVNLCTAAAGALKCSDDAFHTIRAGVNYHFGSTYVPLK